MVTAASKCANTLNAEYIPRQSEERPRKICRPSRSNRLPARRSGINPARTLFWNVFEATKLECLRYEPEEK
jgi:hypothetical protein